MIRLRRPRVAVLVGLTLFGVAWALGTVILGLVIVGLAAIAEDDGARFGPVGASAPARALVAVILVGALLAIAASGLSLALIRRAYRRRQRRSALAEGPFPQASGGEWPY